MNAVPEHIREALRAQSPLADNIINALDRLGARYEADFPNDELEARTIAEEVFADCCPNEQMRAAGVDACGQAGAAYGTAARWLWNSIRKGKMQ